MGKISNLMIETEEAGYDPEIMSICEMLEVREHGKILDNSRDAECNIQAMLEKTEQEWKHLEMCRTEHENGF